MLTDPYVHFNLNTRKVHHVSSDGDNDNNSGNVMTMVDYTNLYIKNLDSEVKSYDLFKRFRVFGKIISARVMKDPITTKSKGYGFVSFQHMEEANEALQQMNGALINTKNIVVTFHEHKKQINNNKQQQQQQRPSNSPTIIHHSYPSPQSISYPNYGFIPEQKTVTSNHNPWNETGIWMHANNKNPAVVPQSAAAMAAPYHTMHVPTKTTNIQNKSNGLVSPISSTFQQQQQQQQQEANVNNQIQYQKLREAIYLQLSECQYKDLDDLVDMFQSLKKRDLSLCLFNPTFLKQKIDDAYEALFLFQSNNSNVTQQQQQQTVSMSTTPSLIHRNIQSQQTETTSLDSSDHATVAAILSSLEGMSINKKKRVFGDIFFPYVRATGIKHAPKVTIRLLDSVPLEELALNMYNKTELTKRAQYAYSELYG